MERVGKPYTDVVQLIQDVLHDQVAEEDDRYVKHNSHGMFHVIRNNGIVEALRIAFFF